MEYQGTSDLMQGDEDSDEFMEMGDDEPDQGYAEEAEKLLRVYFGILDDRPIPEQEKWLPFREIVGDGVSYEDVLERFTQNATDSRNSPQALEEWIESLKEVLEPLALDMYNTVEEQDDKKWLSEHFQIQQHQPHPSGRSADPWTTWAG